MLDNTILYVQNLSWNDTTRSSSILYYTCHRVTSITVEDVHREENKTDPGKHILFAGTGMLALIAITFHHPDGITLALILRVLSILDRPILQLGIGEAFLPLWCLDTREILLIRGLFRRCSCSFCDFYLSLDMCFHAPKAYILVLGICLNREIRR